MAALAFWKGLMYDRRALDDAERAQGQEHGLLAAHGHHDRLGRDVDALVRHSEGAARVQARGEAGADLEAEQAAAEERVAVPVVGDDLRHRVDDRLREALGRERVWAFGQLQGLGRALHADPEMPRKSHEGRDIWVATVTNGATGDKGATGATGAKGMAASALMTFSGATCSGDGASMSVMNELAPRTSRASRLAQP